MGQEFGEPQRALAVVKGLATRNYCQRVCHHGHCDYKLWVSDKSGKGFYRSILVLWLMSIARLSSGKKTRHNVKVIVQEHAASLKEMALPH